MIQVTPLNNETVFIQTHQGQKFLLEKVWDSEGNVYVRSTGRSWECRVPLYNEHRWVEIAFGTLPYWATEGFENISFGSVG